MGGERKPASVGYAARHRAPLAYPTRSGYRDPESQAFIESWFAKLKQRCTWREEFESLDEARATIGAYIERYHHRPHQGLAYRTPREVAATWKDHQDQSIPAA
jgi:putative transposase